MSLLWSYFWCLLASLMLSHAECESTQQAGITKAASLIYMQLMGQTSHSQPLCLNPGKCWDKLTTWNGAWFLPSTISYPEGLIQRCLSSLTSFHLHKHGKSFAFHVLKLTVFSLQPFLLKLSSSRQLSVNQHVYLSTKNLRFIHVFGVLNCNLPTFIYLSSMFPVLMECWSTPQLLGSTDPGRGSDHGEPKGPRWLFSFYGSGDTGWLMWLLLFSEIWRLRFHGFFWRKRLEIRKKALEMGSSYPILIYRYLSFVSQLVELEFLKSTALSWWNNSYKGLKLAFDRCNQEKPAFFGTLLDKLKALDPRLAGCKQL